MSNSLHINLNIELVDGIDGAGKTTYINHKMWADAPDNVYKFRQKFPTVYPKNWDTVSPSFFLHQMREEKMGLNQIIYRLRDERHELEREIVVNLYVDRSFYSTAAYANDLQAFLDGLEILQDSINSFQYILPELSPTFTIKVVSTWLDTNVGLCSKRINNRGAAAQESSDPLDAMDEEEQIQRLTELKTLFESLYKVSGMNLNRAPVYGVRKTKPLIVRNRIKLESFY